MIFAVILFAVCLVLILPSFFLIFIVVRGEYRSWKRKNRLP